MQLLNPAICRPPTRYTSIIFLDMYTQVESPNKLLDIFINNSLYRVLFAAKTFFENLDPSLHD
jgi:hypothetical protein